MIGKLEEKIWYDSSGNEHTSQVVRDHKCDNCKVELKSTLFDSSIQPDDALEIHFIPYYNGYFDMGWPQPNLEDRLYRYFWLCEKCADLLIRHFPCFKVKR